MIGQRRAPPGCSRQVIDGSGAEKKEIPVAPWPGAAQHRCVPVEIYPDQLGAVEEGSHTKVSEALSKCDVAQPCTPIEDAGGINFTHHAVLDSGKSIGQDQAGQANTALIRVSLYYRYTITENDIGQLGTIV